MFVPGKIYYCGQMSSPMKFAVGRCPCGQRAVWADVLWADVLDSHGAISKTFGGLLVSRILSGSFLKCNHFFPWPDPCY